jgi:hypothetical protein
VLNDLLSLARPQPQKEGAKENAAQLLSYVVYIRNAGFYYYNVTSPTKGYCSTSLFPLDIKHLLKEDTEGFLWGFLMGD